MPEALCVGGCVRDALLEIKSEDIDIATIYTPEQVKGILEKHDIKVIPTGLSHGTITATNLQDSAQITTLRKDEKTDGRHAKISYTQNWEEDARRRDFTFNTLLCDLEGNVYDPLGTGIKDLKNRRVRFVGEASMRVQEDYLRILRYFRFYGLYGSPPPDNNALLACHKYAFRLNELSKERITWEFNKILLSDNAPSTIKLMHDNQVLEFLSLKTDIETFGRLVRLQKKQNRYNLTTRYMALFGNDETRLKALKKNIIITNKQQREWMVINQLKDTIDTQNIEKTIKRMIYEYGRDMSLHALLYHQAFSNEINCPDFQESIKISENWEIPDFPLSGSDLIDKGFQQGPELGATLQNIKKWWIEKDFQPGKQDCLKKALEFKE